MIKKLIREKSILIEILFFFISIILLIIAFFIKMNSLIKDFFINAGSGILTASVISVVYTLEKLDIVSQLTNVFDISSKFSVEIPVKSHTRSGLIRTVRWKNNWLKIFYTKCAKWCGIL